MARKGQRPEAATLPPARAASLLRAQIEKGKQLLASRPIASAAEQAWETATRDILIRAFGSQSANVGSVMDVGRYKFAFGGGSEAEYEQARAETMETRLAILDGLVPLLDAEQQADVDSASAVPTQVEERSVAVTELDVVLSWSGQTSKQVAKAFHGWLPKLLPGIKPWMSSEDISKGKPWFDQLKAKLETTRFCIICLTPENTQSPWLYFEAGAVAAKQGDTGICSFLVGVEGARLSGTPIGQFQWTIAERDDTWRLVRDINRSLPAPHNEAVLEGHFKSGWPQFKRKLDRIAKESSTDGAEEAETEDDQVVDLSPEAQQLLLAAATDAQQNGSIMMLTSNDVHAGSKGFTDAADPRSVALWRGAVEELFQKGFLEDRGGKHEVFFLTSNAYKKADESRALQPDNAPAPAYDDNDIISILETWMSNRTEEQNTAVITYAEVDKELNLPVGTAQRLLEQAAQGVHYVVERKGANTVKFKKVLPMSQAPSLSNPSLSQRASRYFGQH